MAERIKTDVEVATDLTTKLFELHKAYEEGTTRILEAKDQFLENSKGAYANTFKDMYNMIYHNIMNAQSSIAFLRTYLSGATMSIIDTDALLMQLMDVG